MGACSQWDAAAIISIGRKPDIHKLAAKCMRLGKMRYRRLMNGTA